MSKYYQDLIRYFFRHEVSEDITRRVHERMVRSEDDSDDVLREMWDETDRATMDEASVEKAYRQTSEKVIPRKFLFIKYSWLRVAAIWTVPFLLLCGSFYLYNINRHNSDSKDVAFIHKHTSFGERRLIILPDSSKVWLNGGSTLIYPSAFVSNERNVSLSGEAFFDVVKGKQPFVVDVNQVKLKVLGTTFNVFSYPDNSQVVATLETGKIQVSIENSRKAYILSPNDQMVFDSSTGDVNIRQVSASNFSSWRTGTLNFEDIKFGQAIQQLEHVYDVKVHVLNKKYNEQTIHAQFNTNESVEEIMAVLKMLIPSLDYEINGKDIFIR